MEKIQLPQIKTFYVFDYDTSELLDKAVNNYVVEIYGKEGNYPKIKTNSKFISVIGNKLKDINK